MRAGASIPPPSPLLLRGFYVADSGFPRSVFPFVVLCTNQAPELNPVIPYATITVDENRHPAFPRIDLTRDQYTNNFLPVVDPAVNSGRPHILDIDHDREIAGTWWTGTRDEVDTKYRRYLNARIADAGSGAEGGKRHKRSKSHKRSDKRRKSHKRSGKSRRH